MKSNPHKFINEDAAETKQLSIIASSASKNAQAEALKNGISIVTAIDGVIIKTKPDGSRNTIKIIQSRNHKVTNPGKVVKFKFK